MSRKDEQSYIPRGDRRAVDRETKKILIAVAVVAIIFLSAYAGVRAYSGVNPPFTVINSGSMMHSSESRIGIIDTGDMLLVKDPDTKDITTYVEGRQNGYRHFGEYGDVIVYMKPNQNIIHRAMIFMELKSNSGGTVVWHIPSLQNYEYWNVTSDGMYTKDTSHIAECWDPVECLLTLPSERSEWYFWLTDVGYAGVNVYINLYKLAQGNSEGYAGYLTKGDNAATNTRFDQTSGIYENKLVERSIIKSVAVFEVPWIGCIKLMVNGHGSSVPDNSKRDLIILIIVLIVSIVAIDMISSHIARSIAEKKAAEEEAERKAAKRAARRGRPKQ